MKTRHKAGTLPWPELPFIVDGDPLKGCNGSKRNFWSVKSTGDAMKDSQLGNDYALALLRWENEQDSKSDTHPLLPNIVSSMPRGEAFGHIEISFIAMMGFAARAGIAEAERLSDYWKQARAAA